MNGLSIAMAESGLVPDPVLRAGIRRLLKKRIIDQDTRDAAERQKSFVDACRSMPIALHTDLANEQHYEVPPSFFEQVLGPRLKYSCGYYDGPMSTLAEAEEAMLALTCERAQLTDGQRILELGCGWGSLTLWMAEHYPHSAITAVSNSRDQRIFIEARAAARGLANVQVVTADMNDFQPTQTFDRVVSVEMFEHMRNYEALFKRVASWLEADGRVFVHIFCHRSFAYAYETDGADNWMGRYFFTGGTMPSFDLFGHYDKDLRIEERWEVNGMHYYRACMDWLRRMDANREIIRDIFTDTYGPASAGTWIQRWRMFFLACAELFAYRDGTEWFVAHYRFTKA